MINGQLKTIVSWAASLQRGGGEITEYEFEVHAYDPTYKNNHMTSGYPAQTRRFNNVSDRHNRECEEGDMA